jgi:hypothetical protein
MRNEKRRKKKEKSKSGYAMRNEQLTMSNEK